MSGRVIVITGPTATGKTALGARLALELGSEVISADSMQIYEHMDIGTAKPTEEEMLGVPHHMIGCVSPFESYSVSRYVEDGSRIADELIARGLQEGKLTNALAENWAKEQDCAVLAAYLEHAPAAIPGRMEFAPDRKAVLGRNLSEADEAMIRRFGFDKDEYQQAKQG